MLFFPLLAGVLQRNADTVSEPLARHTRGQMGVGLVLGELLGRRKEEKKEVSKFTYSLVFQDTLTYRHAVGA